jgi:hypothetical protein
MFQENCKYLPGIKLGTNVIADPDLESAGNHTVTRFWLSLGGNSLMLVMYVILVDQGN